MAEKLKISHKETNMPQKTNTKSSDYILNKRKKQINERYQMILFFNDIKVEFL